ncbi:MAG: DUF6465 family protein [Lachnospiraceae bacterium]|jgi:hypothetical protein|nr:DUF6465 family protein [Lachnospiraceae bacterium]
MAETKKTTAATKTTAVKATAAKATTAKATAAKTTAAKATTKKATATKATAKASAKKPATAKKPASEMVKIEFNNKSYTQAELVKSAKEVWKHDIGKKAGELKSIELYVKPDEEKVYYVFNNDVTGSFPI